MNRNKTKDFNIQWFCRGCWEKGKAAITLRPFNEGFKVPTLGELLAIATTCHLAKDKCSQPDIRLHAAILIVYDSKKRKTN